LFGKRGGRGPEPRGSWASKIPVTPGVFFPGAARSTMFKGGKKNFFGGTWDVLKGGRIFSGRGHSFKGRGNVRVPRRAKGGGNGVLCWGPPQDGGMGGGGGDRSKLGGRHNFFWAPLAPRGGLRYRGIQKKKRGGRRMTDLLRALNSGVFLGRGTDTGQPSQAGGNAWDGGLFWHRGGAATEGQGGAGGPVARGLGCKIFFSPP